jgi:hypothetical protein
MPSIRRQLPRSVTARPRAALTATARSPKACPTSRHSGLSSGASVTHSTPAWWPTHEVLPHQRWVTREGNQGTTLYPAWPAYTLKCQLFGAATPGPSQSLRRLNQLRDTATNRSLRMRDEKPLDTKRPRSGALVGPEARVFGVPLLRVSYRHFDGIPGGYRAICHRFHGVPVRTRRRTTPGWADFCH